MRPFLVACFALAIVVPSARGQGCPSSSYQLSYILITTQAPTANDSYSSCDWLGCGGGGVSFSVPQGSLNTWASGNGDRDGSARVDMVDEFRVLGVAPGAPIALRVVLDAYLSAYGQKGSAVASISDDRGGHVEAAEWQPPSSRSTTLALDLSVAPGEPFRLTFRASSWAWQGSASSQGSFSFTGLPPGASIQSCKGYVQGQPVSTRPLTWGRLKTLYR